MPCFKLTGLPLCPFLSEEVTQPIRLLYSLSSFMMLHHVVAVQRVGCGAVMVEKTRVRFNISHDPAGQMFGAERSGEDDVTRGTTRTRYVCLSGVQPPPPTPPPF